VGARSLRRRNRDSLFIRCHCEKKGRKVIRGLRKELWEKLAQLVPTTDNTLDTCRGHIML